MKQIKLLNWLLEVDVDKTEKFYNKDLEWCDCLYCNNFMEACKQVDPSVKDIFTMLGINPSKTSHLSEFGKTENDLYLYIGSYHIVGRLVEGEYCTDSEWSDTNTVSIGNFTFGFGKDLMFAHDDLPRPILQLEFEAQIPWVLNEKPED